MIVANQSVLVGSDWASEANVRVQGAEVNWRAMTCCKASMEREARGSSLQDRKATDPKPASVGPQGTLEYDITGKDGDVPKHIHIYMMPIRKTWGFMYCRCTEEQWEKYEKVFEEMLKNAK